MNEAWPGWVPECYRDLMLQWFLGRTKTATCTCTWCTCISFTTGGHISKSQDRSNRNRKQQLVWWQVVCNNALHWIKTVLPPWAAASPTVFCHSCVNVPKKIFKLKTSMATILSSLPSSMRWIILIHSNPILLPPIEKTTPSTKGVTEVVERFAFLFCCS